MRLAVILLIANQQYSSGYYGVEAQLLVVRAGLMIPKGAGHHPRLALGVGLGF